MSISHDVRVRFGTRHLVNPGAFPASFGGESWGTHVAALRISGRAFTVSGLSRPQKHTLTDLWPEFIVDPSANASRLSVFRTPQSTFRQFERWVYDLEFEYAPDSLCMAGLDLMARLRLAPSLEGALWVATEAPDTFHAAFENFLRVVVAYGALELGGALVHSAGLVEGPNAWLFPGHSGAGKSTISKLGLASGKTVLSDDLNPILPTADGGIELVGSPFLGDEGTRAPANHSLTAIYRLEQGDHDAVRPMKEAETLASLMACSPYLNRDPHRTGALFSNLSELVGRVSAHVLTFRRDGTFWPLLERKRSRAS